MSEVRWYGAELLARVNGAAERALAEVGEAMVIHIKDAMETTPRVRADRRTLKQKRGGYREKPANPSQPYHAPAIQHGDLLASIHHEPTGTLKRRVGSNIKKATYGLYLELGTRFMDPRPWLRPALYAVTGRTGEEVFENLLE